MFSSFEVNEVESPKSEVACWKLRKRRNWDPNMDLIDFTFCVFTVFIVAASETYPYAQL